MKISNRHERFVAATPERVAAVIADFDAIWPTQIAPAPRRLERCLYEAGPMLWQEVDRPGAARAFRVTRPEWLQGEHWFELECVDGGTRLRHTVKGQALGKYEAVWSERIEPTHDRVLEALLDNVEAAVAAGGPGVSPTSAPTSVDVVLQVFDAVERRDEARQRQLFHPQVELLWPPSLPYQRAGWQAVWDPLQPTPAERRLDPRVVAAHGDEVVVLWQQRGVDRAGRRFACPVLGLYRVQGGRLRRAQMFYFDTTATADFLAAAGTA
jgi:ketosteroid isomerase-like protein